jgi:hypothetical protein
MSVICEDLNDRVDAHVSENARFIIDELQEVFTYALWVCLLRQCHSSTPLEKELYGMGTRMFTDVHRQNQ